MYFSPPTVSSVHASSIWLGDVSQDPTCKRTAANHSHKIEASAESYINHNSGSAQDIDNKSVRPYVPLGGKSHNLQNTTLSEDGV